MLMRNCYRVLLLVLLLPSATLALGLGEIHLKSALNAPLDADIDVVGAGPDELSGLKVSLASREAFGRSGLEYPAFLGGVTLEPQKTADGRTVIHMHSADAINEPIATVLVEVNWARGHLVREYTVLLDPPVFSGEAASATSVAAPVTGDSARSGSVERRAPSAATSSANSAPVAAPASVASAAAPSGSAPANSSSAPRGIAAAGGSYTVRGGDTLSAITAQAYGAGDRLARQRELVAVYRANPAAFDGNMNILRAGRRLTLPGDAELTAISPGEASAEVHRQYSAWNGGHGAAAAAGASAAAGAGQLRLVPPKESAPAPSNGAAPNPGTTGNAGAASGAATSTAAASAAAASAALQQRVGQLESQLAESQRLLQVKNAELAALQARPAQGAAAPAPAAPAAPPAAAPTPAPAPAPSAATAPPPAESPAAAAPTPPPAAKPHVAPTPVASESGNSFLDLMEEYWYLPAGLVAVLVILLVLRAVRSRQEDAFDRSLGRLSQPGFESKTLNDQTRVSDTVPLRALGPSREEQSYRVEESGAHELPAAAIADTGASGRHVAIDDHVPTEAPVALDQGDPLAEADFHMAYGLYDQAADLVQIAISREPERRDLRLKLLEVFFVWGNKDRFLASARELAATRDKALPGEWEKIVIMGRQIAPEDGLFGSSGALPGAASGGVDLNLEGGQNRIDFDLMGEPTVGAPNRAGSVDLDLGAALGDSDATGEARPASESGVDFVFDDAERGNEQTGSTREMPGRGGANTTVTVQVAGAPGADPDAPTLEQPQLPGGDHPTIRQKIDAATRGGMVSSEQTAELELHDLGLDLGGMDTLGDDSDLTSAADAPTLLAGLGDETRKLLTRTDSEHSKDEEAKSGGAPTDSGTWLFTDTDFADIAASPGAQRLDAEAPTEVVTQLSPRPELEPEGDGGSTARLAALESDGLDLDLGDLNKVDSGHDGNGVDLDVGTPSSSSEGTFVQTQRIMAEDIPLPDLEPATMSEVGTKLDLARAYMDMGDPEGARSILSEVLSEGSVSQKQEARRLIDTLPG